MLELLAGGQVRPCGDCHRPVLRVDLACGDGRGELLCSPCQRSRGRLRHGGGVPVGALRDLGPVAVVLLRRPVVLVTAVGPQPAHLMATVYPTG